MLEGEYKYALDSDMDSPHRNLSEARNEEINRLIDERQALLSSGKTTEDPDILRINNRLMELTGSRAATNFAKEREAQVENVLSDAEKSDSVSDILAQAQIDQQSHHADSVKAHDTLSIPDMERRNEIIWQAFLAKDFAPTAEGMADKFRLIRDSIEEYKFDINLCLGSLSQKRRDYYKRQIADLDNRMTHYLAQREPKSSYQQLLSISKIIFPFFEDYKHLHYNCVHEASKNTNP